MLLLDVVDMGCRVSLFFSLYNMVTLGLREFECQSFKEFLKWKEKEEEDNNTFYAPSTWKKPFTDINTGSHSGTSHKLNGTYASLDM